MDKLIENFTNQLKEAVDIAEKAKLSKNKKALKNIIICGMGGSGIGASIISEIASPYTKIPIIVNKDYGLPNFADSGSLVVISSYSGNTEETVSSLNEALKRKAKIVCIASGGKTVDIAKKNKLDHIIVPSGMPPRSCLGYSIVQILFIMIHFGIAPTSLEKDLLNSIKLLENEKENIKKEAKNVAQFLFKKTPIVYTQKPFEGTAIRLKQQLNENSKVPSWNNILPEMNHNELLGWTLGENKFGVIFMQGGNENPKMKKRILFSKEVIKTKTSTTEIIAKGKSVLEKNIYLINLGDYISLFLAELNKIDAMDMQMIEDLKKALK